MLGSPQEASPLSMRKIYLASSWRNLYHSALLQLLRNEHEVYDFKNPAPGNPGFSWSQVQPEWETWTVDQYREGLNNPIAEEGFLHDFNAMEWADTGVLLLPSGHSAHLEAGYFVGAGKDLFIMLPESTTTPELMYKMANKICISHVELLEALRA